ncbi:hypothetical protein GS469_06375 [Rhodococcus hoagii]|nr:hypothetical protein [Prescottella equi]
MSATLRPTRGFASTPAADVTPGDLVKVCGQWRKVKRVNPKSVSVETGYSWTDTVKYDDAITDVADGKTGRTRKPGDTA